MVGVTLQFDISQIQLHGCQRELDRLLLENVSALIVLCHPEDHILCAHSVPS
jgi:hypothetical protein